MRIPRDLSGKDLIKRLERLGYRVTRQTGSHIRLSCDQPKAHHITIPNHEPLRVGTLSAILAEIAASRQLTRDDLLRKLLD
jgi:predicted RNA binding protein YcfA (HicA-like mRNA interferase family)